MFENKNITYEYLRQSFGQIEIEIAKLYKPNFANKNLELHKKKWETIINPAIDCWIILSKTDFLTQ
jgi:hypothetical protein